MLDCEDFWAVFWGRLWSIAMGGRITGQICDCQRKVACYIKSEVFLIWLQTIFWDSCSRIYSSLITMKILQIVERTKEARKPLSPNPSATTTYSTIFLESRDTNIHFISIIDTLHNWRAWFLEGVSDPECRQALKPCLLTLSSLTWIDYIYFTHKAIYSRHFWTTMGPPRTSSSGRVGV